MAEHLDLALALDQLLDIAIGLADRLLLELEVSGALPADCFDHQQHHHQHRNDQEREHRAQHQHHHKGTHHRDAGGEHLHNAVAQRLAQGIHIVGIAAHQLAVRMRVKEGNRQILHMVKQIAPDIRQRRLRNADHQPHLQIGAGHAGEIDAGQHYQRLCQGQEISRRRARADERQNIFID